ncbi:uncharacterized protein LOC128232261 isoform X2 [Mya arenaria]|nr:uncharacterized protein LOC128232261 isoform X2 [Mya arenaria]XP_052801688.1 uncharacterized protein LOC128232261 isoform X2 [Mya arenaria]
MMTVKDIIRQANSSRVKYVLEALVEIRKTYIKSPAGVSRMVLGGLVERLLELIKTRTSLEEKYRSKVIDMATSILGNMCMEECARSKVNEVGGMAVLVELFLTTDVEHVQNRACRCLANMLLLTQSWEVADNSAVIERVVKLLKESNVEEHKSNYIRTIRLLGKTGTHVRRLVEKNGVIEVARLLDSDSPDICQAALRCIHSLSVHSCSEQFSCQVVSSGQLSKLLTLAQSFSHEAFKLVVRLCEYCVFRQEFGSAGGIETFKEMYQSEGNELENWRLDILNVLCLCCKEVVNRLKIREQKVFNVFMESLESEEYKHIHERIISALLYFIYDDKGFPMLLEAGLVNVLIKCLKLVCGIDNSASTADTNVNDRDEQNINTHELQSTSDEVFGVEEKESKTKEVNKSTITVVSITAHPIKMITAKENESKSFGSVEGVDIGDIDSDNEIGKVEIKASAGRPVYSINSPTYKPQPYWKGEETDTPTCIQRFTPLHAADSAPSTGYSPFSSASYYSPGESSPEYGSCTSPQTGNSCSPPQSSHNVDDGKASPVGRPGHRGYRPLSGSQCPDQMHPKYPKYTDISCQLYKHEEQPDASHSPQKSEKRSDHHLFARDDKVQPETADSPKSCMSGYSGDFEDNLGGYSPVYSPCFSVDPDVEPMSESDEIKEKDVEVECDKSKKDDKDYCYRVADNEIDNADIDDYAFSIMQDKKDQETVVTKNQAEEKVMSIVSSENNPQLQRACRSLPMMSDPYVNNILVLLSRVSQMENPTPHLVTMETVSSLLSYLSEMEKPHARCARLLSRVFRNPLCFEQIINLGLPVLIYNMLLRDKDVSKLAILLNEMGGRKKRKVTYSKGSSLQDDSDSDRFSVSDWSMFENEPPSKRQKNNSDGGHSSTRGHVKDVSWSGWCGLALLEDLSGVASSMYGRGLVERLLLTAPQLHTALNILYITWSLDSRQYYFIQLVILDQVLTVMKNFCSSPVGDIASVLYGISLLTKVTHAANKFCKPIRQSVQPYLNEDCKLKNVDQSSDSVCFLVNDEKVLADRSTLVSRSDIFSAMLSGNFSESSLSEVPVTCCCSLAFRCVVHYIHGCEVRTCDTLQKMYCNDINTRTVSEVIDIVNEADKYMLDGLKAQASDCLFYTYINSETAYSIFKVGALYRWTKFLKAAVTRVFCDNDFERIVKNVQKFLCSDYSELFIDTICDILTE